MHIHVYTREREKERERDRQTDRKIEREGDKEREGSLVVTDVCGPLSRHVSVYCKVLLVSIPYTTHAGM